MPILFLYLIVVGAGISVALQQVLNANLRTTLSSPWWAGFVSYLLGTVVMLIAGLCTGAPQFSDFTLDRTSWMSWTGGFFGAIFIATAILMIPRLGAATVLALIVVGQMLGSLAFDHFGILGLQKQPITLTRTAGVFLLIAGVILVKR